MSQQDVNLEVIERLSRVEAKLDAFITHRPCDRQNARIAALEMKVWMGIGGLVIVGSVVGYITTKLPLLQLIAGVSTP